MVRDQPAAFGDFRRAYAGATGDRSHLPAFAFGDSPALADELAALVRSRRKRATAALLADLEHDGDPVPAAGDRSVILDGRGAPVCVVETVDVRVGPLDSVDPAFAWDEGEGDRTREDWLALHRRFYARRCADLGLELSDSLPVVFERFAVVWPEADVAAVLARRGRASARALRFDERTWVAAVVAERRGGASVARSTAYPADALPGVVAECGGRRVGLATFRPWPRGETEVVTLDALVRGRSYGRLLLEALGALGRQAGWRRLWGVRRERVVERRLAP